MNFRWTEISWPQAEILATLTPRHSASAVDSAAPTMPRATLFDATTDNGLCDYSCYGCTDPTSCSMMQPPPLMMALASVKGSISRRHLVRPIPCRNNLGPRGQRWCRSGHGAYSIGDSSWKRFALGLVPPHPHDSYGDGICCDYGIGEYELSLDGAVLFGGAFVLESSTFCLVMAMDAQVPQRATMTERNPRQWTV